MIAVAVCSRPGAASSAIHDASAGSVVVSRAGGSRARASAGAASAAAAAHHRTRRAECLTRRATAEGFVDVPDKLVVLHGFGDERQTAARSAIRPHGASRLVERHAAGSDRLDDAR